MKWRYWLLLAVTLGLTLTIDQVSKLWIVNNLEMYETIQPIPALGEYFRLTRSYNTGAAFGIFENAGDLFMIIAVIVVAAMILYYPRIPAGNWTLRFALGLISGGALGNAIDRLTYGHVVDFVHLRVPGMFSNISNFADHAIVIGVLLIILDSFVQGRKERRAAENAPIPAPNDAPVEMGGETDPRD